MKRKLLFKTFSLCLIGCLVLGTVGCNKESFHDENKRPNGIQGSSKKNSVESSNSELSEERFAEDYDVDFYAMDGSKKDSAVPELREESIYTSDDCEVAVNNGILAGTLTGGELRDLKNWDNWIRNYNKDILKQWYMNPKNRISVYVHSEENPLNNVKVRLMSGTEVVYEGVTAWDGYAYLFYSYGKNTQNIPDAIEVEKADGNFEKHSIANLDQNKEIKVESDKINDEIRLDLMFVMDTTGSMIDELEYLKVEIENVVERVYDETGANIRTSVNFYRDEEDEYKVKAYDFYDNISEVSRLITEETADGGGDYPEAVHLALDNGINEHEWAEDSTVKIMFLVLDAPPHEDEYVKEMLVENIEKASKKGIRIIPVVASGGDEITQQIMRAMGIMTGGTYLFLDDNSGVGGSHEIPADAKDYKSEYLNDMIIRVIGEYCGVEIKPQEIKKNTEEPTTEFEQ